MHPPGVSAVTPRLKLIGVLLGLFALEVAITRLIDVVAARVRGEGLAIWAIRYTNFPFLLCWALIAVALIWSRRLSLPWIRRSPSVPPMERRRTMPMLLAGGLLLVWLYAGVVHRLLMVGPRLPHVTRLAEMALIVPLLEEVLFRGILWEECRRVTARLSPNRSLVVVATVSSLAFAAWHVPTAGTANLVGHALFGLAMALVRQGLGRLLPCVACHAAANVLTTVTSEGWG